VLVVGILAAVGGSLWLHIVGLGCGLGNASVYPVATVNDSVESPSDARGTVVELFDRHATSGCGIETFVENRSVFNREFVYRQNPDEEFTKGIRQRGAPIEDGERFHYFSREHGGGDGETESGEVFRFEPGIC
jgi:hypothetical protein